ncbi:hypothetical protein TR51_25580 [Kitasatospora griseola]|uniref:Uncharacterized protein n=1 Tax=Kitasatospora griseola TaxID=2064 RepID=A0A0D0PUW5_KITGR|nr:hypothetical protein [Kitasatospora griseola]KIQ62413.1 hypothetical protein TR51_25580 [Kitasatospora griseola]
MNTIFAAFICYGCKEPFFACPDCVATVQVDPVTNRPPDATIIDGRAVHIEPSPEAVARSVREAVCDACVTKRNNVYMASQVDNDHEGSHIAGMWELWEDRHRRAHA